MNLRRIGLALIALLLPIHVAAMPQQPAASSTRLVIGDDPSKLEKELNEAAANGYRICRAAPERIHNAVANILLAGGHDDTSGAVVLMERIPSGSANYQYAVIRLFARVSSWERDINKAASQGFRVIPGYGTLTMRQGFVLGTAQVPITIMEKAPEASEVKEYVVAEARQMGNFEHEVNQRFANHYGIMYIGQFYALHLALMEKRAAPVDERLLTAKKDEELEAKIRASAAERFCIVHTESTLEDASHGDRLAHVQKCDTAPEYIFTENNPKARADFDKAVADGYRVVPTGIFGKAITLVKGRAGERYEYRFVKDNVERNEARQKGYIELPLSYPIWHSLVLERPMSPPKPQ